MPNHINFRLPSLPLQTDGDTIMGKISHLLTLHFSYNQPGMFRGQLLGMEERPFRLALPISERDAMGGMIGARSRMWIPLHRQREGMYGIDGDIFNHGDDPMGERVFEDPFE